MNKEKLSIVVESGEDYSFTVYKPFTYKDVTIKKGFVSNGANVPRIAWSVVPPNYMAILPAIAVHDKLCKDGEFDKADMYFIEILELCDIPRYQFHILSKGVRGYSKYARPLLKKLSLYKQDDLNTPS